MSVDTPPGWASYELPDGIHVAPLGDGLPHELNLDCPCGPDAEPDPDGPTAYIHHRREADG